MNEPIDVATTETLAFLTAHLSRSAQLIEVGCGEGRVALALRDGGYRVTGLDSDGETVARAKARGAPVIQATWPEFESAPVEAIAFTRSLHHIGSLQQAVRKARDMLTPQGKLLVEDCAFNAVNEPTITWFIDVVRNQALVNAGASDFICELMSSDDPAVTWRLHHAHEVHSVEAMNR